MNDYQTKSVGRTVLTHEGLYQTKSGGRAVLTHEVGKGVATR